MRRSEKEVKDLSEIEAVLKRAAICRLGFSLENIPYIVPMNFGYKDNCLYFHSAKEGKKIDIISKNPNVCFEIEEDTELVIKDLACNCSMKYISIIGLGKVSLVEDPLDKKEALDIIMRQYTDNKSYAYSPKQIEAVTIFKVQISEMSCKKSGY
ncbi:pyridoxamine 5'-phosphate oxidase family protein [Cellulosilyticum sp. I15G10I2]|uniref:pyridoxamine 5'-phosphate oxidase family protein n=1 Tax=Cellulosilyticum sp. I15G10I2 TaxID=1892843 RepID=UPI00085C8666|nr:pyridoxamine 5'-phosphate oxidase family protein [Cellulosilyticum sp. I15G10I2]